jgi:RNA 2',3'-cyclic 3'-phosphodiesterase
MAENGAATARLFIAIELNDEVKGELGRLEERIKQACGFCPARWVAPDKIHLTLNFLGDVATSKIDAIKSAVSQAAGEYSAFQLSLSSPGAFPNLDRPHVVWVGLEGDVAKLLALQKRFEQFLSSLGFPPEARPFSPHLTLARVRDEASPADRKKLGEAIVKSRCERDCAVSVSSVSLIQSKLTPDGPVYTVLFNKQLGP